MEKAVRSSNTESELIVMGDMNAKIENEPHKDIVGKFGLGERNDRGDRLIAFCEEQNIFIANIWFQQPPRRCYIRGKVRETSVETEWITLLMVNKRFRNSVRRERTAPGADISSDHNPVLMEIKLKLKKLDLNLLNDCNIT